jgi:hypothetical protein
MTAARQTASPIVQLWIAPALPGLRRRSIRKNFLIGECVACPKSQSSGNTARAIGAVCAADLTLSGHEVRFAVFPGQNANLLPELRKAGGFTVDGGAEHLVSAVTRPLPCCG